MNWIDIRKKQLLDEHEKRKSYEDIEERALNTQADYQKAYDAIWDKIYGYNNEIDEIEDNFDDEINKVVAKLKKEKLAKKNALIIKTNVLAKDADKLVAEAKKKGFKIKEEY